MYPHTEDTHVWHSGQRDCHSLSLYFQPVSLYKFLNLLKPQLVQT